MYRVQRHIYDATRKYYLLGRDRVIAELSPPTNGTVLEVGCGTGRNLIVAARRWPEARFYGVDISAAMIATARRQIDRAGLVDRVMLAEGDATRFEALKALGVEGFDRIVMSYTLSMIPDWEGAIRHAVSLLAPGGRLNIVDFGQQERLPGWWRGALLGWLRRWHVTPRERLAEVVASVACERGYRNATASLHRGYAWYARIEAPSELVVDRCHDQRDVLHPDDAH